MSDTPDRQIEIVGHGGAGDFYPGNSRESILFALGAGVDRIEFDLLATRTGEIVLVHDEYWQTHPGFLTSIRAMTTDEVRARATGLLTLDELFEICGPAVPLLVDVKTPGFEDRVIAGLRAEVDRRDLIIASTYGATLKRLRKAFSHTRIGFSTGHIATGFANRNARRFLAGVLRPTTPLPALMAAQAIGATEIMIEHSVCSPYLMEMCRSHGLGVFAWTVDRPADIARIAEFRPTGIITNRPDLAREHLGRT
jgi:glycerophosphoryl diester phosphodiesterase